MFIKRTKAGNATYIQITKSFRDGKKTKHQVVLNLGRDDKINLIDIDGLITVLQELRKEYFSGKAKNMHNQLTLLGKDQPIHYI
jgi:hypothetical protein